MTECRNSGKIEILTEFYEIYENFISAFDNLSCRELCSHCCTRSVTATSLEADWALAGLEPAARTRCLDSLEAAVDDRRFMPVMTTNIIAGLTMEGKDLPCEENDHDYGPCPLLSGNRCTVYPSRPFACRCMVSDRNCLENGFASMDPFILTVNNVFLQYIEHLDSGGVSGNLIDIFLMRGRGGTVLNLPENKPARVLMVPPEHRERIRPIVETLARACRPGR